MALPYYKFDRKNRACEILGSGGASRAVSAYLQDKGASSITIVSRNPEAAENKYPELACVEINTFTAERFDLVVNTTPVGMAPKAGASPITKDQLSGTSFVMDLIYNPEETLLLKYAQALHTPCANGLYMLVAQAIAAQEIWQGKTFASEIVNGIFKEMRKP